MKNSLILCIDLQEKLVKIAKENKTIENAVKFLQAVSLLDMNVILTEQYPKGLGSTIAEILKIKQFKIFEKETFSAFGSQELKNELAKINPKNIILFGIETHICVYQTAIDLMKQGYNVYIVADCCASRSEINYKTSLELMKQQGIYITTLEIVLFEILKSSKHPAFKEIQTIIK